MTTKAKPKEALPAQPLNRLKLLEAIRDSLKTANGKTGMNTLMQTKEPFDAMGEILPDQELQAAIFRHVMDGDERAIVRRFFQNLDE